jgi:hypothetical protein
MVHNSFKAGFWLFLSGVAGCAVIVAQKHRDKAIYPDMLDYFDRTLQTPEFLFQQAFYPRQAQACFGTDKALCTPAYPAALVSATELMATIGQAIFTYSNVKAGKHSPAQAKYWLKADGGKPEFKHAFNKSIFGSPLAQNPLQNAYIQKLMLPAGAEVITFGDLHGSIHAFARMLCKLMADGYLDQHLRLIKPNVYMIFLGDLTDYGRNGADTLYTVLKLRTENPSKVFLCRGNHEEQNINEFYGFAQEIVSRYPNVDQQILSHVYHLYEHLPYAIFLGMEGHDAAGYAQCCHGGIEPNAIDAIASLLSTPEFFFTKLPAAAFSQGSTGLNWSDFTGALNVPPINKSPRGVGVVCSIKATDDYMNKLNIKVFLRGHQDGDDYFKVVMHGLADPQYFFTQNPHTRGKLEFLRPYIEPLVTSPTALYEQGFRLGDLPKKNGQWVIAPVFTFTNASASRCCDNEGFGLIELATTWSDAKIHAYGFTTPLMSLRHLVLRIGGLSAHHGVTVHDCKLVREALGMSLVDQLTDKELFNMLNYAYALPQATYIAEGKTWCGPAATQQYVGAALKNFVSGSACHSFSSTGNNKVSNFLNKFAVRPHQKVGIDNDFKSLIRCSGCDACMVN